MKGIAISCHFTVQHIASVIITVRSEHCHSAAEFLSDVEKVRTKQRGGGWDSVPPSSPVPIG